MLNGKSSIQRAVLTVKGHNGAKLTLVTFVDGDYGILRNNEFLDGCRWRYNDLDACIHRLLSLADGDEMQ